MKTPLYQQVAILAEEYSKTYVESLSFMLIMLVNMHNFNWIAKQTLIDKAWLYALERRRVRKCECM